MSKKTILLTISGPSLTGKSVFSEFLKPFNFEELVSETTRPIRQGEVPGKTYNYITVDEFKSKVANNEMLQHNPVDANFYGLSYNSYQSVAGQGKNSYVVVAPAGAKQIKEYCEKNNILCHQIFINNDLDLRLNRFLDRFKNDEKATASNYANRLIGMLNVEEATWVAPAISGTDKYDQVFPKFDQDTQKQVLAELLQAIELKLDSKNKQNTSTNTLRNKGI